MRQDDNGLLVFDSEEEAEYPFRLCLAYAGAVKAALRDWALESIPPTLSVRAQWVENMLLHCATKLLAKQSITDEVMPTLMHLLDSMSPGAEAGHFCELLSMGDFRGTDVSLNSQSLLDATRQVVPYPAFAWKWVTTQGYPWKQSQHINALEFVAFLIYVSSVVADSSNHSLRYFRVLDSTVSSCIVAKGRSSGVF